MRGQLQVRLDLRLDIGVLRGPAEPVAPRHTLGLLPLGTAQCRDRLNQQRPSGFFAGELACPRGRESVVLSPLMVGGRSPRRSNEPALFEAVQRGIQGTGLDSKHLIGARSNRLADPVSMLFATAKRLKNQ